MKQMRTIGILAFVTCIALMGPLTRASFHNWEIQEVYTNYDGSVQFINLFTTSGFETQLSGQQIQATSDGMTKTFTFNANAPNTTNKHLLIATPGFASLTSPIAVSADFTFPVPTLFDRFFEPDATNITINFVGADSVTFTGALLPKDGVNALHFTIAGAASVAANMPTNFAGATGSVNLPPPMTTGDYNGDTFVNAADYTVWRNTLGQDVAMNGDGADGDADGEIDLGDYNFWKSRYGDVVGGAGAGQAAVSQVPEPTTLAMAVAILSVLPVRFDRRSARRAVRK